MSIVNKTLLVSLGTLFSRISGYLRDIFLANYLGTTIYADLYVAMQRFPNLFRRIFAEGAMASAFIPLYRNKLKNQNLEEAKNFSGKIFVFLSLVLFGVVIVSEIFMQQITEAMLPGASDELLPQAVKLIRISTPYLLLIALVALMNSILNCHNRFMNAAFNPIVTNLGLIAVLIFGSRDLNNLLEELAWVYLFSAIIQLCLLHIESKRHNLLPNFASYHVKGDKDVKKMLSKMLPVALGSGVTQINLLISTAFASYYSSGLSALYYADRLILLPVSLIGTAIGTVMLPEFSGQDKEKQQHNFYAVTKYALILALPAMFGYLILGNLIVEVLFKQGKFASESSMQVTTCLQYMSLGLIPYILLKIIVPLYYANFDYNTPLRWSVLSLAVNLVINLLLIRRYNVIGIALATSISAWANLLGLYYQLGREFTYKKTQKQQLIKVLAYNLLFATILTYFIFPQIAFSSKTILLAVDIVLYMLLYFGLAKLLKIWELPIPLRRKKKEAKSTS